MRLRHPLPRQHHGDQRGGETRTAAAFVGPGARDCKPNYLTEGEHGSPKRRVRRYSVAIGQKTGSIEQGLQLRYDLIDYIFGGFFGEAATSGGDGRACQRDGRFS
jgi:hypothetical protein